MTYGLKWAKGKRSHMGQPREASPCAPNPRVWGRRPRAALVEGLIPSPSPYLRAAHSPLLLISFIPFLPSSPLLSLALAPLVWSWLCEIEDLEVLPPSEHRRAAGFLVWNLLLPLSLLDRSPEDVRTPYVCRTAEVP